MEPKDIKKFLEIIEDTDVIELQYEKAGIKIGFKKSEATVQPLLPKETKITSKKEQKLSGTITTTPEAEVKVEQHYITIKSTMVGTYYISPTPDAPPYVQEGTIVKNGQKIGVVEAMKIMKEITSDIEGRIIKILVENGHPVEYGQAIYIIDPIKEEK